MVSPEIIIDIAWSKREKLLPYNFYKWKEQYMYTIYLPDWCDMYICETHIVCVYICIYLYVCIYIYIMYRCKCISSFPSHLLLKGEREIGTNIF